jgi:hypothetical protein
VKQIRENGPFKMNGDVEIMQRLEEMLASFVAQRRMKLDYENYTPCWVIEG